MNREDTRMRQRLQINKSVGVTDGSVCLTHSPLCATESALPVPTSAAYLKRKLFRSSLSFCGFVKASAPLRHHFATPSPPLRHHFVNA